MINNSGPRAIPSETPINVGKMSAFILCYIEIRLPNNYIDICTLYNFYTGQCCYTTFNVLDLSVVDIYWCVGFHHYLCLQLVYSSDPDCYFHQLIPVASIVAHVVF